MDEPDDSNKDDIAKAMREKNRVDYWNDFDWRHDEVTLSTLLTFPEKTDFGYWFEREIGTEWGWNEYEEYFDNGEFDQTMCGLYFFEITQNELEKVEERERWVLEQREVNKT